MRRTICLVAALLPFAGMAQTGKKEYPRNYFRNPLNIPILLAGNFGECRSGHFHSGLDIKTQGKENLPVYAAAEGYISRIKTEKGGFGHAIYITHPNGYTTVYAHLNKFTPYLQTYLRKQQYQRSRWDLDLPLSPAQFPVKKGQQIAWSGNTGGSSAPHLHFEIRDSETEHPLNPQLFGLTVADDVSPVIHDIVLYTGNVYEDEKLVVSMVKKGSQYKPARTSNSSYKIKGENVQVPSGMTGIGVSVDDYMNGSSNTITFYQARLFIDGALQSEVTLDNISYSVSRYMHAYTDYKMHEENHKWVQCFFRLPGNKLRSIYSELNKDDGRVLLGSDTTFHELRVEIEDNNGNVSEASMILDPQRGDTTTVEAPDDCNSKVPYDKLYEYRAPAISFTLSSGHLYDDICMDVKTQPAPDALSDRFQVHYPYVPVHSYFDLKLKPNKTIPIELKSKVVLMYSDGKDEDGRDASLSDQGWYKARVRNFGSYWLALDTTAPVITTLHKDGASLSKTGRILLTVKDAMTSVHKFSGYIDDVWVCFEQHRNSFFYEFDEHCLRGKHHLMFKAEDENGNESRFEMDFSR